ncbi:hypothetical protein V7S43_008097 [Phytophthora oleae]|uniref:Shugoshin C-terminal domain-containing protein n=1 Tax=Phytophthora oleae TaxID=2107226 RepID=A0ABD3FN00_9STRA
MAQPSGTARVLSVMQELRQLRDKVCTLSEKNRALAKALTGAKQELTKARAAQSAVFSNKVTEWMESRRKPTEVQHRSIQCNLEELDEDTCASVGTTRLEPEPELEPSYSPFWGERAIRPSQSTPRVPTSAVFYKRAPAIFARTKVIGRAIEESASTEENDEDVTKTVATTDSTGNSRQYTRVNSSSERAGSQAGVKRRLRQRDTSMSYVEPKLNTKLRRGDYYGLGKRPIHRPPKPRVISGPRGAKSAIVPARFGQCSPFRGKPTTRTAKRVSYVEPKLNTKLRQVCA